MDFCKFFSEKFFGFSSEFRFHLNSSNIFFTKSFFRTSKCEEAYIEKILRSEEVFENIGILTTDLLYKIDPGHCYTLITDPLYFNLLQPKLFQELGRSTYFVIRVRFNEDMITPKNKTIATLRAARRAGCRCYLIYLANGIQMSRFLRYIDRFVAFFINFFLNLHFEKRDLSELRLSMVIL